jgi:glycosyltransferase involved in cell wall biosynthesis
VTTDAAASNRVRVCMITPSFYPIVGGLETQVEQLIPHLRRHGIDAWVLTRRTAGTTGHEERGGTTIRRIPIPGGPGIRSIAFSSLGTLTLLRQRQQIDIVHAHGIMSPATVAVSAGMLLRVPRVVTIHAAYEPAHLLSKPFGATRLRRYQRLVDRFISISDDIRELLVDHGMPTSRIIDIPNGIDTHCFRPVAADKRLARRAERGLAPDEPVAVFVGRLHPVKQVHLLIEAWKDVPAGRLVILGDGEERDRLERLASTFGITDRVDFRGMVTDIDAWLQVADIFVLPSASEGLSVALLEAMSSGTLPVATAVGGAVDLIQSGTNGILVPAGDVAALTDALRRAVSDRAWRVAAAHAARETVLARYDLDAVAQRLASLYRELITAR